MEEIITILEELSSSGSPLTIKTANQGEKIKVQIRVLDGDELSTINLGSTHLSMESALRYSAFTLVQMERGGFNPRAGTRHKTTSIGANYSSLATTFLNA